MPEKVGWLARLVDAALTSLEEWIGDDEAAGDDPRAKLHVRQQHLTGCGIAIVAMVAQVKYAEARNVMFGKDRRREFSTFYSDLRAAFDHYRIGYAARARRASRWAMIPAPAVVTIRNPGSILHWVLLVEEDGDRYVLDPLEEGYIRTDWRRMRAMSFLELDRRTIFRKANRSPLSPPGRTARGKRS